MAGSDWLERLRSGDAAASEALVQAHYRGVYRFLLWLCRDPETAADLTQETFAGFWQSVRRREGAAGLDPKAWLFGIARNQWRKRCRDAHPERWARLDEAEERSLAPGAEVQVLERLEADRVQSAVAALPPELREVLVLRVWEQLSYAEMADALMISEGLARWRVHRARRRLAALLETREEGAGASR